MYIIGRTQLAKHRLLPSVNAFLMVMELIEVNKTNTCQYTSHVWLINCNFILYKLLLIFQVIGGIFIPSSPFVMLVETHRRYERCITTITGEVINGEPDPVTRLCVHFRNLLLVSMMKNR